MRIKLGVLTLVSGFFLVAAPGFAAEQRCTAEGKKVECPTRTKAELDKALENYENEAMSMMKGAAGSTYGITGFDFLTGVGKRSSKGQAGKATLAAGDSGYGGSTGKTEVWDRIKKPAKGDAVYNQWANNWSPSFKKSLIAGASPNEGKQWYYVYCVGCHGWLLRGDGPNAAYLDPYPRDLTAGSYMNKKSNVELFTVIKGGGSAADLSDCMPSWGNLLHDQDIWNVISWIRANADVKPPKSLEEYLNPKSSFNPDSAANAVTPLNSGTSAEFKDSQELLEGGMLAGRGGDLKGGGFVEGGMRKAPQDVKVEGY